MLATIVRPLGYERGDLLVAIGLNVLVLLDDVRLCGEQHAVRDREPSPRLCTVGGVKSVVERLEIPIVGLLEKRILHRLVDERSLGLDERSKVRIKVCEEVRRVGVLLKQISREIVLRIKHERRDVHLRTIGRQIGQRTKRDLTSFGRISVNGPHRVPQLVVRDAE